MNKFFKVTIRTLKQLPWEDLRNLFAWPGTDKYKLQVENPNLLIAKASDENGEPVAYLTAESILLVDGYTFAPQSTPEESGRAGDSIDRALAAKAGAKRMWIVVPNDCPPVQGERILRVYERRVHQPVIAATVEDCTLQHGPVILPN